MGKPPTRSPRKGEVLDFQQTDENSSPLQGHVAVVTGGGRGIGRAIALALAAAAAHVAVLARSGPELAKTVAMIEQAGGKARAFATDVTDATAVCTTMEAVERLLGPVDLLVNNAAQLGPIGPFCETDTAAWWHAMDANLRGPALCTHAVLPGMISRHRGRVINIASSAIPIAYFSSYATSKTALVRFTETVAAELKPHGVTMFAVGPGTVRTAMSEYSLNSPEGRRWLPWFRRIFDEGLDVPAERPAQLVLQLASGRADALSGRFLTVSDDLDAVLKHLKEIEENDLYSLRVRTLDAGTRSPLASIRAQAGRTPSFELRLERTFAVPRDKVFRAWTIASSIKQWFPYHAAVHWSTQPTVDAKPGGHFSWTMVSDGSEKEVFHFQGTYRDIQPARKLAFSWEWDSLPIPGVDTPGNTLVTIEFLERGGMTKVVLTQSGLPGEAARKAHEKGWNRCFDGIEQLLQAEP